MNDKTKPFSSIEKLYQEKEGRTIMPVFEWVEAIKSNEWEWVVGRYRLK
jgi:hypothetical protein